MAPDPGTSAAPASPPARVDDAWRTCRVEAKTLLNTSQSSRVVGEDATLLFAGEDHDIRQEITFGTSSAQAMLRLHVRIRASVTKPDGVLYFVTSQGTLASAVGFGSDEVGRDQVRDVDLTFDGDGLPRFLDVFASPALGVRVVMVLTARPATTDEALPDDRLADGTSCAFKVEALLKEKGSLRLLEQASLAAPAGQVAGLAFGSLSDATKTPADPAHRFGAGVEVVDIPKMSDVSSGFGQGRTTTPTSQPTDYMADHRVGFDQTFLNETRVSFDDKDAPSHVVVSRTAPQMSARKQKALRDAQAAETVRRAARERSEAIPAGQDLPQGFEREELEVSLTPLHASNEHVQVQVALKGRVRLPGEKDLTPVDTSFLEQLQLGEPYEIGIASLLRGGDPDSDYLVRIVPSL